MQKVTIPYEHNPQDLSQVWLAISLGTPREGDWRAAYRDMVDGRRVVWAKYPSPLPQGNLWVKDRSGTRRFEGRTVSANPEPAEAAPAPRRRGRLR